MGIRELYERVRACKASTAIANAFRKALGIPAIWAFPSPKRPTIISTDRYEDMAGCFRNAESIMDGR